MDGVVVIAVLGGLALLPVSLRAAVRLGAHGYDRWERRPSRRRRDPLGPPIERLSRDLRRLLAELDRIEQSNPPMKVARLRATSLAYDDVLVAACRALEVDVGAEPPLRALERLEAEAELVRHGLRW
jgi:hypothetical protein